MKKRMLLFASLLLAAVLVSPAFAGTDRPIAASELPAAAQQFLKKHFAGIEVVRAEVDEGRFGKEYDAVLADGSKVEFDATGRWEQVACKRGAVPASVVPQQIRDYVAQHYKERRITSIERNRRDYEVKLDKGLELKFDLQFRLIEVDD